MKRILFRFALPCLIATAFNLPLHADVVTVSNGDRITGEVVKKEADVLRFKTAYAGTLEIRWSEVVHLEMAEPAEILLEDEMVVEARTVTRDAGVRGNEIPGKQPAPEVDPEVVASIKPEPWELGEAGRFTGRSNFAMKLESGNTDKDEIDFDFFITYEIDPYRVRSLGQLEYDLVRDTNTKRDWFVFSQFDRFLTDKTYLSLWYGARQEKYPGLNLRQIAGPAIGHEFYQGKPTRLVSELGLVGVEEDYVDATDTRFLAPAWYLEFEHDVLEEKATFYHKHYAFVRADDAGKQVWHSWTGFRVPLFGGLAASTELELEYDSQPAFRADTTDTTVRFKLGYLW